MLKQFAESLFFLLSDKYVLVVIIDLTKRLISKLKFKWSAIVLFENLFRTLGHIVKGVRGCFVVIFSIFVVLWQQSGAYYRILL